MEVEGGAPAAAPAQPAGDAMELEKVRAHSSRRLFSKTFKQGDSAQLSSFCRVQQASEGAEKTAEQQPEEKKMDEELPKQQEPEQEAEEKKDEATETPVAKEPAVRKPLYSFAGKASFTDKCTHRLSCVMQRLAQPGQGRGDA
jgi:D-alanyl-D-alanine carboxypeptidase